MSEHIITKSKMVVDGYVDAAVIGRRLFILPGEVFLFIQTMEEVAEVIVACGNEPCGIKEQHERLTKQRRTER